MEKILDASNFYSKYDIGILTDKCWITIEHDRLRMSNTSKMNRDYDAETENWKEFNLAVSYLSLLNSILLGPPVTKLYERRNKRGNGTGESTKKKKKKGERK